MPQTIFVVDGKTYYLQPFQLTINRVYEFLNRYDELGWPSYYESLSLPLEGYLIYLEYWKKGLGQFAKRFGHELFGWIKRLD
jgi:hypothetical protein